jgi:hypothetical protein
VADFEIACKPARLPVRLRCAAVRVFPVTLPENVPETSGRCTSLSLPEFGGGGEDGGKEKRMRDEGVPAAAFNTLATGFTYPVQRQKMLPSSVSRNPSHLAAKRLAVTQEE